MRLSYQSRGRVLSASTENVGSKSRQSSITSWPESLMRAESSSKCENECDANRDRVTVSSSSEAVDAFVAILSKAVSSPYATSASVAASVLASGAESGIGQEYRFATMTSAKAPKGV
ncbi:Uncharacterised protein [Mycobacteroides abscessus subsp. abscessus]|nr:Uncharacterised protein [Mycobacteroides abscessus subsp. abscessus]